MALIFLKEYSFAVRDAYSCIRISKHFAKGYFRLGLAFSGLELYTKAAEAFSIGLSLSPGNKDLRQGFAKAKEEAYKIELSTITWTERPVLTCAAEAFSMR
jgi:stress-induced-phosphoprotein 1